MKTEPFDTAFAEHLSGDFQDLQRRTDADLRISRASLFGSIKGAHVNEAAELGKAFEPAQFNFEEQPAL